MSSRKDKLKNLFLLVSVVVGMVIALEFSAHFLIAKKVIPPIPSPEFETYKFDSKLGWSIKPNIDSIHRTREFEYPVKNNSLGMRYREFSKEKSMDVYRIAVLGDSFTWGFGVADSERFTDNVEKVSQRKIEMLNFGVSGYGPIQYYLLLDEIVKYKPDMVLIAFFSGNDFLDNVFWNRYGCYKPYATINTDGGLEIQGYPLPDRFAYYTGNYKRHLTWIEKKSYIAYRLGMLFQKINNRTFDRVEQKGLIGLEDKDFYLEKTTNNNELAVKAININALLFKKIKEELEAKGIKLVVLEIPSKYDYGTEFRYEWSSTQKKNYRLHDILMTTLENLNIERIELIDDITPEDFWVYDVHWRASGHEKAAKKIMEFLTDRQIINER